MTNNTNNAVSYSKAKREYLKEMQQQIKKNENEKNNISLKSAIYKERQR